MNMEASEQPKNRAMRQAMKNTGAICLHEKS